MTTATETESTPRTTADNDYIVHIVCTLDDSRALCGLVLDDDDPLMEDSDPEDDCVVCVDMENLTPCPICGTKCGV